MTNFDETTYSISDTAAKLSISEKTLRRWEEANRFTPKRTIGNQRRYSLEDLQILDAIKHDIIPHQKDLLTIDEAAKFLGTNKDSIENLVNQGRLQPFVTVKDSYYPRHRLMPLLQEFDHHHNSSSNNNPSLDSQPEQDTVTTTVSQDPKPHSPSLSSQHARLSPPPSITQYLAQIAITVILITTYHLLYIAPSQKLPASPTSNQVQGAATNPSLKLLDDMLDPTTGGLTTTTLTSKLGTNTPNLTLIPGVAPISPIIGSLYFDAGDNSLKLYTANGWQNISTAQNLDSLRFDLESKIATPSGN